MNRQIEDDVLYNGEKKKKGRIVEMTPQKAILRLRMENWKLKKRLNLLSNILYATQIENIELRKLADEFTDAYRCLQNNKENLW